jgi:cytochrome P450
MHDSFGGARPFIEVQDELIAAGHDVVVDESGLGALFLRAEDCEQLMTSRRFGPVAMPILALSGVSDGPLFDLWSVLMFGKGGDDHRRIRSVVAGFFTPSGVERWRPAVDVIAGEVAATIPDYRAFDLWDTFALPVAARTTCHTVGIPDDDVETVAGWALALVQAFAVLTPEGRVQAEAAAAEFTAYLDRLLANKRATPAPDLASAVVGHAGESLSYEEQRGLVANLTFGGMDALIKVITTGVFHLLTLGRWPELVAEPSLALATTEELLRFHPPTGAVVRGVVDATECAGVKMTPGQIVIPSLRAACRDSALFDHPDELDLHRSPGRQFAFGAGPHFCLGAPLVRLAIPIALTALARRCPTLRLAEAADEVQWGGAPFYGVERMRVRLRG